LESDGHTKLVINEPDGADVNNSHALLTLLDSIKRDRLLAEVVSLRNESPIRLGGNLELESRGVRLLTRANHGLVESLSEYSNIELLTKPLLRVLSDSVNNNLVKLLERLMKLHSLSVIRVKRKVKRVGGTPSALIGKSAQTVRGAHEGKLNVELFVIAGIEVDGLTAILVLTKFREANGLGREIGGSLDSERHCVVVYISIRQLFFM